MPGTKLQEKEISFFFLLFACVFGAIVRIYPVVMADFPLVDGGMFYTMIHDLQAANLSLPQFTTYNQIQIPFAYPPLGFYLGAILSEVTGVSVIHLIQWLPLIFNLFTLPVFYIFLKRILHSQTLAALATLVYALTPNSYWWTVVGGGLTRSLGTFFFALTLLCVHRMYLEKKAGWVAASIFSAALLVLSHLTWTMQALVAVALLWFFYGRDRQGVIHSFLVAGGVLLLTSPWWWSVVSTHGLDVFALAFQVNHSRWLAWTILFALSFTGESTTVIAVFALVGLFVHLARRNYFFAAWALLCLLSDPRGGTYASVFPFAVLAASAISEGVAFRLGTQAPAESEAWWSSLQSGVGRAFWGFFIILFLYNAFLVSDQLRQEVVSVEERAALEWIRTNTPADAVFIVLDEQGNPLLSPFVEWFPALSERRSLTTIQGTEWLPGDMHYNVRMPIITSLRSCVAGDAACIEQFAKEDADYIVVSAIGQPRLLTSLEGHAGYELVYASLNLKVFQVK